MGKQNAGVHASAQKNWIAIKRDYVQNAGVQAATQKTGSKLSGIMSKMREYKHHRKNGLQISGSAF